jgi:hypothetical protein
VPKRQREKAAAVTEFAGKTSAVAKHEVNSTSSNIFHIKFGIISLIECQLN